MAAKARLRLDGADPINRGLVGFWPLTDGAGGRALDISTFRNNGALENSPGQYSTLLGKALNFTGGGAGATNVNLGNPNQFNALQVPLTITGWAFPTASPLDSQTMLAQYGAFAAGKLVKHVSINAGVLRYISSQSGGVLQVFTAGSMTANTWQFWAIVMSGTHASPSLAMYVNQGVTTHTPGALDASPDTSIATRIGTSTTALITPSNEGYQGRLQNVRMWSRALSRAEIQRLYRDPWAGTLRTRRRVLATTGTPHTAAPGAGTETYAGQGATVKAGATLLPGAGAETYSGKQAAVTAGATVAVGAGTETYQGLGAGVTQPATVAVGAGLVEVLGLQAALGSGLSGRVVRRGRYRTWDDVPTELAPVVALAENYADELAVQRAVDDALARFAAMKAKTSIARRERLVGDLKRAIVAAVEEAAEADDEDALIALL